MMSNGEARRRCAASLLSAVNFGIAAIICAVISVATTPANASSSHHTASTDCNQEFDSRQQLEGTFSSPGYPQSHQGDITCRYRFNGHGRQRVQITFDDIDLNTPRSVMPTHTNEWCSDVDAVTVTVFIDGQPRDIGVYCGNQTAPRLMSNYNRLDVTFVSRSIDPVTRGFHATFRFVENFGITDGEIAHDMTCGFIFKSTTRSNGTFTSPNYPGIYPRTTECHYLFYGRTNEKVHITFAYFDIEGISPKCDEATNSDYVEFSNFNVNLMDRKMYRLCGTLSLSSARNDVTSDGSFFRVTFMSNDVFDARGFEAYYQFRRIEDPYLTNKHGRLWSASTSQDSSDVAEVKQPPSTDVANVAFPSLLSTVTAACAAALCI